MCGIGGIVNTGPNERPPPGVPDLARMLTALGHRGPDERGLYHDANAGLAHTRLSVIDLTTGQQPLSDGAAGPDGPLWIVFNGELFNYLELRAELESAGCTFRTRSDTEVVVRAWRHWGEAALSRFNGQWALALWAPLSRRLVLSRDPMGIRPLYYAEAGGRLVFGSEVKALFAADPELPRAFDPAGVDQTLTFWSPLAPRTVFRGVRELEPGHVRVYERGRVTDRAYWEPDYDVRFDGSLADASAAVREALERATSLRMLRADVDVGCYLSGGIDSSLTAALAMRARGRGFHTFSLRFEDAEYDESGYQRLVAERLGTEHHDIVVRRSDIAEAFPAVVRAAERPILRTAPAPLFLLSRLVRDTGIKVVLTGEGADEMFAGYDLFREGAVRRFWARDPRSERRPRLLEKLYPYLARSPTAQRAISRKFFGRDLERWREPGFAHGTRWATTAALKRLVSPAMRPDPEWDPSERLLATLPASFGSWSRLAQDQYLEVRTFLSAYLLSAQGDRVLMGNSVEGRFPFLDPGVVALANSLPARYKLRGLDEKHVLKRCGADLVPAEILARTKQPYRSPDAVSFAGSAQPGYVDEVLSEEALAAAGVFTPRGIRTLWRKCQARADSGSLSNTDNMALIAALSTQLLWRDLIRMPAVAPARDFATHAAPAS